MSWIHEKKWRCEWFFRGGFDVQMLKKVEGGEETRKEAEKHDTCWIDAAGTWEQERLSWWLVIFFNRWDGEMWWCADWLTVVRAVWDSWELDLQAAGIERWRCGSWKCIGVDQVGTLVNCWSLSMVKIVKWPCGQWTRKAIFARCWIGCDCTGWFPLSTQRLYWFGAVSSAQFVIFWPWHGRCFYFLVNADKFEFLIAQVISQAPASRLAILFLFSTPMRDTAFFFLSTFQLEACDLFSHVTKWLCFGFVLKHVIRKHWIVGGGGNLKQAVRKCRIVCSGENWNKREHVMRCV